MGEREIEAAEIKGMGTGKGKRKRKRKRKRKGSERMDEAVSRIGRELAGEGLLEVGRGGSDS